MEVVLLLEAWGQQSFVILICRVGILFLEVSLLECFASYN